MMTNDMSDTEKLSEYIKEAHTMGIEVLPPDVNESHVTFAPGLKKESTSDEEILEKTGGNGVNGSHAPNGQAIRFGLAAIKGIGEVAVQSILKARNETGSFPSLSEMCERVDGRSVSRKVLEALIKSGACDCFGLNRATLSSQSSARSPGRPASLPIVIPARARCLARSKIARRECLKPLRHCPNGPSMKCSRTKRSCSAFYVTGHPLTPFAPILEKYCLNNTASLAQLQNRSLTRIGGMIAAVQNGISKKNGKPYSMVTLEDLEGSVQILCMNENYDKNRELLVQNKAILVIGEVNTGEDKPKIFPQEIMPLEDAPRRFTKQVHLRLSTAHLDSEKLQSIQELIVSYPGKCPLFLCFKRAAGEIVFIETHEKILRRSIARTTRSRGCASRRRDLLR